MMSAYFVTLGLMLIGALFIKSARSMAAVLAASWAASFFAGLAGLGILAPYIDGLAFYGLLVFALKSPTKENVRCVWLGVALVAVHAAFNGVAVFISDWALANTLANGYMWTVNLTFIAQVGALIGGRNARRLCGLALQGLRSLYRYPAGRGYARLQEGQKVEP